MSLSLDEEWVIVPDNFWQSLLIGLCVGAALTLLSHFVFGRCILKREKRKEMKRLD
jgi:hypothetical protein